MSGKKEIPDFDSIDELARFLDENDLVPVSLRLPRKDVEAIRRAAKRSGLGYTTYIRILLRRELARRQRRAEREWQRQD